MEGDSNPWFYRSRRATQFSLVNGRAQTFLDTGECYANVLGVKTNNKRYTHVLTQPDEPVCDITVYEYPHRIVMVIFSETVAEKEPPQEWIDPIMTKYRKRKERREIVMIGSDGRIDVLNPDLRP
jgi:hypothetical protein